MTLVTNTWLSLKRKNIMSNKSELVNERKGVDTRGIPVPNTV